MPSLALSPCLPIKQRNIFRQSQIFNHSSSAIKKPSLPAPLDMSENTVFLAPRSPELKPVEVTEEHCCCWFVVEVEVKLEAADEEAAAAGTNPTAVPAAAATAAAWAKGVSLELRAFSELTMGGLIPEDVTGAESKRADAPPDDAFCVAPADADPAAAVDDAEVGESSS